jgi:hypothetical protein
VNIYLATRYARHAEMRAARDALRDLGHTVTSRWVDQHGGHVLESFAAERLNSDPAHCAAYAKADLDDLAAADVVVSFTTTGGGGKGGRHWEMGWAHAAGKRLVLVGPREHVFHTLPEVEHYPDTAAFLTALGGEG